MLISIVRVCNWILMMLISIIKKLASDVVKVQITIEGQLVYDTYKCHWKPPKLFRLIVPHRRPSNCGMNK